MIIVLSIIRLANFFQSGTVANIFQVLFQIKSELSSIYWLK
ncbi:hypothetical protein C789_4710 [Microcystis aeruginosa FACHB-905 = DIANCHI905]|uniref:Uncharacterized protein n=1 Tax=Microcystis aeruginosa PCC 7806SL TaxID=1903187 RepID=A0AB33BQ96_MICA7|nr:hypothetical protein BH695_0424 [Microcystis aeruginosa PCC 7806SL]ELS45468.1 hypothetical protein C789_4710 [Microcystis aeruginosa FACHB-905 = DIANCHI905]